MTSERFVEKFELLAEAPNAIPKLRELVLQLATSGALVRQDPRDVPAEKHIRRARQSVSPFALIDSSETPNGWCAVALGCVIASNTGGGTPSKSNASYWNGPIPWASVKDVQNTKYLRSTTDSITEKGLKNSSSRLVPAGRLIVVTRMGLGKLAINAIPIAINQDLRAIEPTKALDIDYAYLLFKSLKMIGSGMTVKGITVGKLHAMPVLVPPLAEQKRIVAKVDEIMAICDLLVAQQNERESRNDALGESALAWFKASPSEESLELLFHRAFDLPPIEIRSAILRQALLGRLKWGAKKPRTKSSPVRAMLLEHRDVWIEAQKALSRPSDAKATSADWIKRYSPPKPLLEAARPELPDGWAWVPLELACPIIVDSPHRTPVYVASGQFVALRPRDVAGGILRLESAARVGRVEYERQTERRRPTGGDLVYSRELSFGWAALLPEKPDVCLSQGMVSLRASSVVDPRFLCQLLNSPIVREQAEFAAIGAAHPHVNLKDIRRFALPIPPLAEQWTIIEKLGELMELVRNLESKILSATEISAKLLEAIIAGASDKRVKR